MYLILWHERGVVPDLSFRPNRVCIQMVLLRQLARILFLLSYMYVHCSTTCGLPICNGQALHVVLAARISSRRFVSKVSDNEIWPPNHDHKILIDNTEFRIVKCFHG